MKVFLTLFSQIYVILHIPVTTFWGKGKHYQFINYLERHLVTRLSFAPPWNSLVHFGPPQRPINPAHYYNTCIKKWRNILLEEVMKVLIFLRIYWSLKEHLKFGIFCAILFVTVEITACMLPVSVREFPSLQMQRTLVMEIPKVQYWYYYIVRASKINILDPQNLAKYCLSDVDFSPTTK